jgi:hypothetical protein
MMIDGGADNSFQPEPLLGVWAGKISDNFPPGYSTSYTIETVASWVKNPGGSPSYYLQLEQGVVNVRPSAPQPIDWSLEGAGPWDFEYFPSYPDRCKEKTPCVSSEVPAIAVGRYQDAAHQVGFATVVPTTGWGSGKVFVRENGEYIDVAYGGAWVAPRRVFATVFSHELEGIKRFHFAWFVCAGSWEQAEAYARGMASTKP